MNRDVLVVMHGSWEGGLGHSYARAFESLGLRPSQFDLEAQRVAATPLGSVGNRLVKHFDVASINATANRSLVRAVMDRRPALLVIMCNEAVSAGALLQIKVASPGTSVVNVFPDTVFNLRENVVQCLPLYDLFCAHTKAALPLLERYGARGLYLPLAADPTLHHPVDPSPAEARAFGCDVTYVGNWRTEHEQLFGRIEGTDLKVWGSDLWGRKTRKGSWVASRWQGRPLMTGREYAAAHRAAKIGLNPIDPMNYPGHNMRVFELPACRVFSLVSRTPEVTELFREGETVVCFDGADEFADKVRYYLAHPDERQRIADAAYEHVVNGGHTYRDRARLLLERLGRADLMG